MCVRLVFMGGFTVCGSQPLALPQPRSEDENEEIAFDPEWLLDYCTAV